MIYEFIATITAGFGMAGLALMIRYLSKALLSKQTPKWLIPVFAGLGMLGFQIHQEYHWHTQQIDMLPESIQVVKVVEEKVWYRPWSYLKPQVIRFMAVDKGVIVDSNQVVQLTNNQNSTTTGNDKLTIQPDAEDSIKKVNLYLFERRMSRKQIPHLINCSHPAAANFVTTSTEDTSPHNTIRWHALEAEDKLIEAVCD